MGTYSVTTDDREGLCAEGEGGGGLWPKFICFFFSVYKLMGL